MYQQLMHITEDQLQFIAEKVNDRLETNWEDIDESKFGIEVIGHGLDANLKFVAHAFVTEVFEPNCSSGIYNEVKYHLPYAELVTYVDGEEVPNDTTCKQLAKYINKYIN